jgi:hypothetical protein
MTNNNYGPAGEPPSGRILAHNHVRRYPYMPHGWNWFRRWYGYLDKHTKKPGGRHRPACPAPGVADASPAPAGSAMAWHQQPSVAPNPNQPTRQAAALAVS